MLPVLGRRVRGLGGLVPAGLPQPRAVPRIPSPGRSREQQAGELGSGREPVGMLQESRFHFFVLFAQTVNPLENADFFVAREGWFDFLI